MSPKPDAWERTPKSTLRVGQMLRFPGNRVWVISSLTRSRARAFPLTPTTRTITVPDKKDRKRKITKEVNELGDPTDISAHTALPEVLMVDLTDVEFRNLERYVQLGEVQLPND